MIEPCIRNLFIANEECFEHYTDKLIRIVCGNWPKQRKIAVCKSIMEKALADLYTMSEISIELILKTIEKEKKMNEK